MKFAVGDRVVASPGIDEGGEVNPGTHGVITRGTHTEFTSYPYQVKWENNHISTMISDSEIDLVQEHNSDEYVKKSALKAAIEKYFGDRLPLLDFHGSEFMKTLEEHGITFERSKKRFRVEFDIDASATLPFAASYSAQFLGVSVENLTVEEVTNDS